jgi:hypothetical protein
MSEARTSRQVERLPDGGPNRHLASLVLTEGPEHQRIGVAWIDGRPGSRAVELTVDLAPGHGDLRGAVALVQQAAEAAAALDVDTLEVTFDPHRGFPLAVLEASGLHWRRGAIPGSASIDVGPTEPNPSDTRSRP